MDAADFTLTIEHNKISINYTRLRDYGELVYKGGGDDLVKLAADVLDGRMLVF